MPNSRMLEIADRLKALRDEKADLDFQAKAIGEEIVLVEQELIQCMTDEDCESFKHNRTNFTLVIREFPAAIPEMKATLYEKMKRHGFGHLFTINSQTLSATLKELKANNDDVMPSWLDGLVKVAEKSIIQIRKI